MKCNECFKELNEMTLYCDRCGAQVAKEKMKLNFVEVEKKVVPLQIETNFKLDLIEEIKKAYFLSNIRKDFKGFKKRYIEQFIDYVLLRVYYEKNKVLLTTTEFDKTKALALLETFANKKPEPLAYEILKEEYAEDYEARVIPRTITNQIQGVYSTNFNLGHLSPARFFTRILYTTLIGIIKIGILFGLIGAILFFGLPMFVEVDLLTMYQGVPFIYPITGIVLVLLGYVTSRKGRFYYPFEDVVNSNKQFKKHIKTDIKKRIKTLRYRIKKEGKKK